MTHALQLNSLVENIEELVIATKQNVGLSLLEMRWTVGWMVARHPAYSKHRSQVLQALAKLLAERFGRGWSERTLYYCVEFYEKYPQKTFLEALGGVKEDGVVPQWYKIVRSLPSGKREEETSEEKCRHCPLHCGKS